MVGVESVILSNRVEELYEAMKERLFSGTPFARRLVLVPSPAMRTWLTLRMADDPKLGISAGIEVHFMEQGLTYIEALLGGGRNPPPSPLICALAIEVELLQIIATPPVGEEEAWAPLLDYLQVEAGAPRSRKRLTRLAQKMAHLFAQYGRYGAAMVTNWGNDEGGWQRLLWQRLCTSEAALMTPDFTRVATFAIEDAPTCSIHLFANSFLSQQQHTFLLKVAEAVPVTFYLLSPCEAFWSDIKSDRERRSLSQYWQRHGADAAQITALDSYLRDCNPLLANYGKVGREMARQIEESELLWSSRYALSGAVKGIAAYSDALHDGFIYDAGAPLTLLSGIQADMVLLRNGGESIELEADHSIQLHISSSIKREVENLHDTLLGLIAADSTITARDIIVMAPDVTIYTPFIETVFGHELDYQIMDIGSAAHNPLVAGFLKLLALPFGRWEAQELLELCEQPTLLDSADLDSEALALLRKWVDEMGVRWGCDAAHRDAILMQHHCRQGMVESSETATWEAAFQTLVIDLVAGDGAIAITEAETLGRWCHLVRTLRSSLTPLTDGTEMTLKEWLFFLNTLFDRYFGSGDEQEQQVMQRHFHALTAAAALLPEARFPFSTMKQHLEDAITQEDGHYRENHLDAVRFCSMLPMRAIPARVVVLLGMDDGAFPKRDIISSLNLMRQAAGVDYCPTQRDYDRYLFLEIILSARSHLLLSYVGANSRDGKERPPSLLITELFHYLDHHYSVAGSPPSTYCRLLHPFHSFDAAYFSEGRLRSYSQPRYRAAQARYSARIAPPHQLLTFAPPQQSAAATTITIRQIENVARNPLQSYFYEALGIYLKKELTTTAKGEEEFTLTAMERAILARRVLKEGEMPTVAPLALFKELALTKVDEEVERLRCACTDVGAHILFDITLAPHCTALEQVSDTQWQAPPLKVGTTQITGTLRHLSPQGWVSFSRDVPEESLRSWPLFLLYLCLIATYPVPSRNQLLLIGKGKAAIKAPPSGDVAAMLQRYLAYSASAAAAPAPLLPEWLPAIMAGDASALQARIDATVSEPRYNHHIAWCWQPGSGPDATAIIEEWSATAHTLYGPAKGVLLP